MTAAGRGRCDEEKPDRTDGACRRRGGAGRVLGAERARGAAHRADASQSGSRQWPDNVSHRRLLVVPRGAEAGRCDAPWRRACAADCLRHVPRSEYFIGYQGRHRPLERGPVHRRHALWHVAGRAAPLPGVSLHVVSRDANGRPARSLRLSQDLAGDFRRRAGPRSEIPVSTSDARSACGSCCFSTMPRSGPTPRNRRSGTEAPIW